MDFVSIRFENLLKTNSIKAIDMMKKAIELEPENSGYLATYGKYLCEMDSLADGVRMLNKSDKISTLPAPTKFLLANTLLKLNKNDEAILQYKELQTEYPEATYNLAICYLRISKLELAHDVLKKLRESDILGQEAQKLLINIEKYKISTPGMLKELSYYRNKYGEDGFLHLEYGQFYSKRGQFFDALKHFNKLVKLGYPKEEFYDDYANTLLILKNFQIAKNIFRYLWTSDPESIRHTVGFAKCLIEDKEYQSAEDVIDYYLEDNKDTPELKYLRVKIQNCLKRN